MKNCVFLSMDSLEDFECYDHMVFEPLHDLGWNVQEISWRDKQVNWADFDAVVIRSPWDYQDHCEEFLSTLETIRQSETLLANSIELVKWNVNKNYLAELEKNGILIVPTLWQTSYSSSTISDAFDSFETEQLVIKPCISANADDTYWLNRNDFTQQYPNLKECFDQKEFMLQPFMRSIVEEGEFSLFYFNGQYSHAIVKKPKSDDFRVQEEHGGQLSLITPENKLKTAAENALKKIPYPTLYARLDFVRLGDEFAMMEAELIEPSLYFNQDPESATRFAKAFVDYYQNSKL